MLFTVLQSLLDLDDLAVILSSKHHPCCIIDFISLSLQLLNLEDSKRNELESKLSCFHEGIGVSEQLIVVPATFISAASLFCIEEVGVHIEEPFPTLPIDERCKSLQSNIHEATENELMIRQPIGKRKNRLREHPPNGHRTSK